MSKLFDGNILSRRAVGEPSPSTLNPLVTGKHKQTGNHSAVVCDQSRFVKPQRTKHSITRNKRTGISGCSDGHKSTVFRIIRTHRMHCSLMQDRNCTRRCVLAETDCSHTIFENQESTPGFRKTRAHHAPPRSGQKTISLLSYKAQFNPFSHLPPFKGG